MGINYNMQAQNVILDRLIGDKNAAAKEAMAEDDERNQLIADGYTPEEADMMMARKKEAE